MGTTNGPCVSCRGIRRPHLKVSGLPDGGQIAVKGNNGKTWTFDSNGLHKLADDPIEWVEVSCTVSQRHTIMEVVSVKAA